MRERFVNEILATKDDAVIKNLQKLTAAEMLVIKYLIEERVTVSKVENALKTGETYKLESYNYARWRRLPLL